MDDDWLAARFEESRPHLRLVAYRMLGSLPEAEDAVQNSWLRLSGVNASELENLTGWLTTVVARECLKTLRTRRRRREEPIDDALVATAAGTDDPEAEALLADSVGPALMVVLDALAPAERLAFVLHDIFALPFDEIAPIVGRSPAATRQLASRARRRVRGVPHPHGTPTSPASGRSPTRSSPRSARAISARSSRSLTRTSCSATRGPRRAPNRCAAARARWPAMRSGTRARPVSSGPRWWTARRDSPSSCSGGSSARSASRSATRRSSRSR